MKAARDIIGNASPYHVTVGQSIWEVISYMARMKVGAVTVTEEDRVVGIFSERDLLNRVVLRGRDPRTTLIREVMTPDPAVGAADDTTRACMEKMQAVHCRHLPIVDGEHLLGMVSMRDLLREQLEEAHDELGHLHTYIHGPTVSSL